MAAAETAQSLPIAWQIVGVTFSPLVAGLAILSVWRKDKRAGREAAAACEKANKHALDMQESRNRHEQIMADKRFAFEHNARQLDKLRNLIDRCIALTHEENMFLIGQDAQYSKSEQQRLHDESMMLGAHLAIFGETTFDPWVDQDKAFYLASESFSHYSADKEDSVLREDFFGKVRDFHGTMNEFGNAVQDRLKIVVPDITGEMNRMAQPDVKAKDG